MRRAVTFKVEPIYTDEQGLSGYTLWLTQQGEKETDRENKLLMGQLNESRILMRQALEDGKLAAYSFSFDRFSTCDKRHCNRCFQFYGTTNTLLDKNRLYAGLYHPYVSPRIVWISSICSIKSGTRNYRLTTSPST